MHFVNRRYWDKRINNISFILGACKALAIAKAMKFQTIFIGAFFNGIYFCWVHTIVMTTVVPA